MSGLLRRLVALSRAVPPSVLDAALATAVATAVIIAIDVAQEPGAREPDAIGYGFGLLIGALLLARRRWPLLVLLGSVASLMAYYWLEYPGVTPALPLAAALYTAAAAGLLRWALLVAGSFAVLGVVVRTAHIGEPVLPVLSDMLAEASLLLAVSLLGETVRSRRVRLAEANARLARAENEREREAARRVAEERLRIARDIHDVLGHTIAAIMVQAGYADDIADSRPGDARVALKTIREAARQAMVELKASVGDLRADVDGHAPRSPAPGLDRIDGLLDVARGAGLQVDATVAGADGRLPATVEFNAYRILQEALTNTIRHARATRVTVSVRRAPTELVIDVRDNGCGRSGDPSRTVGHGLAGMAERVEALHGRLEVGAMAGGGFRVHARLPIPPMAS